MYTINVKGCLLHRGVNCCTYKKKKTVVSTYYSSCETNYTNLKAVKKLTHVFCNSANSCRSTANVVISMKL